VTFLFGKNKLWQYIVY